MGRGRWRREEMRTSSAAARSRATNRHVAEKVPQLEEFGLAQGCWSLGRSTSGLLKYQLSIYQP